MNEPGVSAREQSLTSCHKSEFEFVFVLRVSRTKVSEHCHFLIYYQDTFTFSAVFSIIKVGHKSESGFSHLRRGFHQLDTPLLLCFDGLVFNSIVFKDFAFEFPAWSSDLLCLWAVTNRLRRAVTIPHTALSADEYSKTITNTWYSCYHTDLSTVCIAQNAHLPITCCLVLVHCSQRRTPRPHSISFQTHWLVTPP